MKKPLFFLSLILTIQLSAQDETINGTTFKQDGKVGIGTSAPDSKLTIFIPNGATSYPTASDTGNVVQKIRTSNNGLEIGNSFGFNDRKSWILARHSDALSYGKYYSVLHLQPDVGDKSQYRGVAIGYDASTTLPLGTHLAIDGKVGIGTTDPNHELTVEGASSPNIELKNSNYSDGGFVLNRTNYGHQWKWWAQSNVMYFGFSTDEANYSNKFAIESNGNVGIGINNPTEKLHVSGNILGNKLMLNDPNDTSDWNTLWQSGFYQSHNATNAPESNGWFWGLNMNHGTNNPTYKYNGQIAIKNSPVNPVMYFRSTNVDGIGTWAKVIHSEGNQTINGNLGIGTTDPTQKLEVDGTILLKSDSYASYRIERGNGAKASFGITSNTHDGFLSSSGSLKFLTNNNGASYSTTMSLSDNGNVGIGTTDTKGFKLGVNGKIAATEVKVATYANWPDYVFNDTYNLPALKEVEKHIKEKGHLKDIPNAKEVKKDGFYLAEMNAKLLQKIEELTLYTIEQQNEIETLKKENKELKSLSKRLAEIEQLLKSQKQNP